MELIVDNRKVIPHVLRRVPGGVEAELAGEALISLLDATFGGGSIEILGGELDHHALDVTDIRMAGRSTTVTLMAIHELALH